MFSALEQVLYHEVKSCLLSPPAHAYICGLVGLRNVLQAVRHLVDRTWALREPIYGGKETPYRENVHLLFSADEATLCKSSR